MADLPEDLQYTPDHEWVRQGNGASVRVGVTDVAAAALGDVVFVTLPTVGDAVAAHDSVAELESTKSVSEVFAPVSGTISAVNEEIGDSPELVNSDPYGDGWLFEVEVSEPAELDELLDAAGYEEQVH